MRTITVWKSDRNSMPWIIARIEENLEKHGWTVEFQGTHHVVYVGPQWSIECLFDLPY